MHWSQMASIRQSSALLLLMVTATVACAKDVPRFGVVEESFTQLGKPANPYTELSGDAELVAPSGVVVRAGLFWEGGTTWRFRFSPSELGTWHWRTMSMDNGLDGHSGSFNAVPSDLKGSIQPMSGHPYHFERQNGEPFWFMGDTAWALYNDIPEERHDREGALRYVDARAAQGFNVLHSMLLSEGGDGNSGGPPWINIGSQELNAGYWQEVDRRLAYANSKGIVCGLALAWGDKRKVEKFPWRRFPDLEARKRYARYIAARFAAYNVYFIVAGEWHGEVRTRGSDEESVRREFIEIGNALHEADAQHRMVAIHPMTAQGSVREFNDARWMSFGDYQQNYRDLHGRLLASRTFHKPVVNSEYGYHLRDQNGDGTPDKDNSTSLPAIRRATWDIVMAGGYAVTGFGTTYFGGHRDPGPFDLDAKKNKDWERQFGIVRKLFTSTSWWKLEPHDELLRCETARGKDTREFEQAAPPAVTYGCLAEPGRTCLVYFRGLTKELSVDFTPADAASGSHAFDVTSGETKPVQIKKTPRGFVIVPPDAGEWLVQLGSSDRDNPK